jgi:DNA-binding NarL/FixJ family response regulator
MQNHALAVPFGTDRSRIGSAELSQLFKVGGSLATSEKSCFAGPIRILVVDDFRPFREVLHQLLDSFSGLTVVGEAEDGQTAIEMASRLAPQVITMDIQMPRLGGVEATRCIKKALPEVHVIGVSFQDDIVAKNAMATAGASAFISKQCAHTLPQLIAKITGSQTASETFLESLS